MKQKFLQKFIALLCIICLLLSSVGALSVENALKLLEQTYVYEIPDEAYNAKTLDELFDTLGDPYTYYMTADQYNRFLSYVEQETELTGIGAGIEYTSQGVLLTQIISGSGAEAAGLVEGDYITAIDGVSCVPADETVRNRILGEAGTKVLLTVLHSDGTSQQYQVERHAFTVNSNTATTVSGKIGTIDCNSFGTATGTHFQDGINQNNSNVQLWTVDLRGNTGGLTQPAVDAVGAFVGSGKVVTMRDKDGFSYSYSAYNDALTSAPLIIMVNERSASASEVFTGAIRAAKRGISVGSRTYGKGVAQIVLDDSDSSLFDGDALKVTAYRFYHADGNTTDRIGVLPTVYVADNQTQAVTTLLSAAKPSNTKDYLKLTLAENEYYVNLSSDKQTLTVLLSALAPDAKVALGTGNGWKDTTVSSLRESYGVAENRWFSDISQSKYETQINTLGSYGIISGVGNGNFEPSRTMTRAEVCAILAKALNVQMNGGSYFSDVPSSAWYAGYVNAMASLGLVDGVGNGKFHPNATMTQEEFLTVMGRLAAFLNINEVNLYNKTKLVSLQADRAYQGFSTWALRFVNILDEGAEETMLFDNLENLSPKQAITREQAAATMCNVLKGLDILVY